MICPNCGNKLFENVHFCSKCGTKINCETETQTIESSVALNNEVKTFDSPTESSELSIQKFKIDASNTTGETIIGNIDGKMSSLATSVIPGPGKVIESSVKSFISSFKSTLKEPKIMIPTLVIVLIWIVLDILKACGINPIFTQILSFITFANGGMSGGFIGAVGGIIGKGIFSGALVSLICLFTNKSKGQKRSFVDTFKSAFGVSLETLGSYLLGIGVSIFFFLFISGCETRISFMGGIASSFLFARAAINNGFLKKFISSITSKGKQKAGPGVDGFIRGLAVGSAASAFLGLIGFNLILIIVGGVLLTSGIVLVILKAIGVIKLGKGANAQ